jgi:uncharacterized protein GlcG (DUF336 family)
VSTPKRIFAQTIAAIHRLPAALALEAVGEAVSACARLGYLVTATVINPDGVTSGLPIATLRKAQFA